MCMVYSLGNISGAHLNPAVTLAVLLRGKCGRSKAACYVAAQLLGGLLAGLSVAAFQGVSANRRKSIQLTMGKHYGLWQASFAELFFTMILAYVVLMVATKEVPAEWKTKQRLRGWLHLRWRIESGSFVEHLHGQCGESWTPGHWPICQFGLRLLRTLGRGLGGGPLPPDRDGGGPFGGEG